MRWYGPRLAGHHRQVRRRAAPNPATTGTGGAPVATRSRPVLEAGRLLASHRHMDAVETGIELREVPPAVGAAALGAGQGTGGDQSEQRMGIAQQRPQALGVPL